MSQAFAHETAFSHLHPHADTLYLTDFWVAIVIILLLAALGWGLKSVWTKVNTGQPVLKDSTGNRNTLE